MKQWHLRLTPREWQTKAFVEWQRATAGIVEVVTGGGKTVFAQMCLLDFFDRTPSAQVLIIVPTLSLLDQWWLALQDEIGVTPQEIGLLSGEERPVGDEAIIIAVINSARNFTSAFSEKRNLLLIVDECHRAGSPVNAKALDGSFMATLGLSATPEREYDEGFQTYIVPKLGPIIYRYTYPDAGRDGVITDFSLTNVHVDFLPDEEEKYRKLTRQIGKAFHASTSEDGNKDRLERLLMQRAAVSSSATMRIPVAIKLIEEHRGERAIIFHERIDAANRILTNLIHREHRATIYHAKIGPIVRRENLRLFRKGLFDVLVCCRALDEGMNVPEASVAVVASSTASRRQRIQRLGRILRKAPGKRRAAVYTIYATEEERKRLEVEAKNLEGIAVVAWQTGRANPHA